MMHEDVTLSDEVRWIGSAAEGSSVLLFRRDFRLTEAAQKAVLQITADGSYRLRVNGMWFGDGPEGCVPGRWSFDSYELSSLLRIGANFIEVQVVPGDSGAVLAASLVITDEAGAELFSCVTDETWSCAAFPALTSDCGTECFNAALPPGERRSAVIVAAAGDAPWGTLHERRVAPLTRTERLLAAACGKGSAQDPEALLFPDDRCALLWNDQDAVSCSLGEKINGCWNVVCRAPLGSVIEFYLDDAATPAVRLLSKGGWQRYTTTRRCRAKEITLKLGGAGPAEIQSLRLVEAAYPAVRRSGFTYSNAREERRWEAEVTALARRFGAGVEEAAELPELAVSAGLFYGADDWAEETLSQLLFTAAERPLKNQLFILLAAARYADSRGRPVHYESWRARAGELLPKLLSQPAESRSLADGFLLCGALAGWGFHDEAEELKKALAASWNPRRLAFCRDERSTREATLRANLAALAYAAVPPAHLASLRAEAASLVKPEELLYQPELPAELGNADALLSALPQGSGRSPLYQIGFLLGIRFSDEGKLCTFSPWIGSETMAEGHVHTRCGEVRARWKKTDRIFTAELLLPPEIKGQFILNPSLAGLTTRYQQLTREEWDKTTC